MSKNEKTTDLRPMSIAGSMLPQEFEKFVSEGFASIETVLIGDPKEGKVPMYVGILQARGEKVQLENNQRQTWTFNPIVQDETGNNMIERRVTQIVMGDWTIDATCGRVLERAKELGTEAIVGFIYLGKGKSRKNLPVNLYRTFERYIGHESPKAREAIPGLRTPALPPKSE